MAISAIQTTVRNNMCNALVDALDVGSSDATGDFGVYTTAFGTLLALLLFSATAFGAASSGQATANSITADSSADATGTAARMRCRDRDNTTVFEGTVGTSGEDFNLNTTAITSGSQVSCSSFTVTVPAG